MKTLLANRVHKNILGLNPWTKWIVIGITDTAIFAFALWAAFALRFASWWPEAELSRFTTLFLVTPFIGVLVFIYLDLYRIVIRFMGVKAPTASTASSAPQISEARRFWISTGNPFRTKLEWE